jgi:hypothetical protein
MGPGRVGGITGGQVDAAIWIVLEGAVEQEVLEGPSGQKAEHFTTWAAPGRSIHPIRIERLLVHLEGCHFLHKPSRVGECAYFASHVCSNMGNLIADAGIGGFVVVAYAVS